MAFDVPRLLSMSQAQLDELFLASASGDIPDGEGKGTAIIAPGTAYAKAIAAVVNGLLWQGKAFDAANGRLKNRILPFGLSAIAADVYRGHSWLDGKDCIVLDYSKTSFVVHWIRDEIRLIGPGLYLGKVYGFHRRLFDFALQF